MGLEPVIIKYRHAAYLFFMYSYVAFVTHTTYTRKLKTVMDKT